MKGCDSGRVTTPMSIVEQFPNRIQITFGGAPKRTLNPESPRPWLRLQIRVPGHIARSLGRSLRLGHNR